MMHESYSSQYPNIKHFASNQRYQKLALHRTNASCSVITGCAVAQHCCKGDQSFQRESPNFDPRISQTPQFFHTKI